MPPVYSKRLPRRIIHHAGLPFQRRTSPCEHVCPAGTAVQSVHFLLAEGRTDEALAFLLCRNPLPGITGRVCPHFCEKACNRGEYDEAVAVRALERHAADAGGKLPWPAPAPATGRRIVVVGSGPAGLSCACHAALLGHTVTVLEAAPLAGGVPRHAIPDFRLPKQVVDYEAARVLEAGDITVYTNVALGRDVTLPELRKDFDACVLAVGLQKERRLSVPGADLAVPAVAWLKSVNLDRRLLPGGRVLIIGGGGVAFDCAFTARRLGAEAVTLVCLEAEGQLRVSVEELAQAKEEGVVIHHGYSPVRLFRRADGAVALEADKVASFGFRPDGSLQLETVPGERALFETDRVICASGLQADLSALGEGLPSAVPSGAVEVDPLTLATSLPGVFAAGDVASGPACVATAIGGGRAAALAAHRYVMGLAPDVALEVWIDDDNAVKVESAEVLSSPQVLAYADMLHVDWREHAPRRVPSGEEEGALQLPFRELAPAFSDTDAAAEAARCLHCGQCSACGECVEHCPGHILDMREDGPFVAWPDQCWHCGCCRIACPDGAISYTFPLTMLV